MTHRDDLSPGAPPTPTPGPAQADLVGAAIGYARIGWKVFPLFEPVAPGVCSCPKGVGCGRDVGKHPRIAGGKTNATTDEAQIREWWRQWPAANIAIALPHPEFFVVDLDPRNGGDTAWDEIRAEHEPLPPTVYQRTGSGGHHGLYLRPPGLETRAKLAPGVDVPTSHIVAAPSLHSCGERYQWIRSPFEHEIAEPPEWLVERARGGAPSSSTSAERTPRAAPADVDGSASGADWRTVLSMIRRGATDTDVASVLRAGESYRSRKHRGERYIKHTIRKAQALVESTVLDLWACAVQTIVAAARYRYSDPLIGKPELHRVRFQLMTDDGEVLPDFQRVTLPLGEHDNPQTRSCFANTIGDLAPPEAWLDLEQRARLEETLRGRRIEIVLPSGGRGRALRMRRS